MTAPESEGKVNKEGDFYIGRIYDLKAKKTQKENALYDPDDLTTHGVVVGMTGSGKTGLGIDILEEAALQEIPALIIDPKGDIANLLLHFPELRPEDFLPWIAADQAKRENTTLEQLASDYADMWKKGLDQWGIEPERITRVRESVEYAVYTPGSDAGLPVNILTSFQAPDMPWDENRETLREKISSTATALLGLVGIEADPVRSREHILLSNIFEHAWQQGLDLDLAGLIQQIQNPPFEKLGALEIEQSYPSEDRFELAMTVNNLLASPSFGAWIEGTSLDIDTFLWTPDGKPRHSVFYLSHLSDTERMFFVTLLLAALESWMYAQSGSPSLRALLYFDEVYGFLPPVAKPPSKPPLLRLLKQARAIGLGILLTTQNPMDLDYKALSNAGTWFIGRLQTERDKARLLDGLEGVDTGEGSFNRKQADKIITALDKRIFLMHNVHEKAPMIFQTRWAMAFLKGPISRSHVKQLNRLVGADRSRTPEIAGDEVPAIISSTRPSIPKGVEEFFLPNNMTVTQALKAEGRNTEGVKPLGLIYHPTLLAQAKVRYLNRKINLDHEEVVTSLPDQPDQRGVVRWEESITSPIPPETLDGSPAPDSTFSELEAPIVDEKTIKGLKKDFLDFVYHNSRLELDSNPTLKLVSSPGMTSAEFRTLCTEAARSARDDEAAKLKRKYEKKISRIEKRITKEERELEEDKAELSGRKMEELATHAENVLGLFVGSRSRRRVSTSLTKRRMTSKAKADVEESEEAIEEFKQELADLEDELLEELGEIDDRWAEAATDLSETVFTPQKKDIHIELFGLAWFPHWQLQEGEDSFEVKGYLVSP